MTDESSVYRAFDRATANVQAWAILVAGEYKGRAVIRTGGARVTAYVQFFGARMASGYATGGGCDRATAAVEAATHKLRKICDALEGGDPQVKADLGGFCREILAKEDNGTSWNDRLRYAASAFSAHNVTG